MCGFWRASEPQPATIIQDLTERQQSDIRPWPNWSKAEAGVSVFCSAAAFSQPTFCAQALLFVQSRWLG
jgi:hypothetical protein